MNIKDMLENLISQHDTDKLGKYLLKLNAEERKQVDRPLLDRCLKEFGI